MRVGEGVIVSVLAGDVEAGAGLSGGRTMVGVGDAAGCAHLLRTHVLLGDSTTPLLPAVNQSPFYAIGAFIYTLPFTGAVSQHSDVFVPATGYQKAFQFCQLVYLTVVS